MCSSNLCVLQIHVFEPSLPKYCVLKRILTFWNPMVYSPPDSSVHGISQARILEWLAVSFFRESSRARDRTQVSHMQADSLPSEPPVKPINGK